MPPASGRTPKARRTQNYEAVGERGRRTGVTLKDTGIRDEHGLEPVPSFSSPTKSPAKQNGITNGSYTDETMDIGDSTIPEPTDLRRGARNSNIRFPIPQATTPKRTNLGSSPRRSVGPIPSSAQQEAQTPTRASSHPAMGSAKRKLLDFSRNESRSSKEKTPQSSGSLKRPRTTRLSGSRISPKKSFDLSVAEDDGEADETMGLTNGNTTNDVTTNGFDYEETAMPGMEEDSVQPVQDNENVEVGNAVSGAIDDSLAVPEPTEDPQPPKKARGRPKKNVGDESMISVPGTPRGRRTKIQKEADEDPQAEASETAEKPKGRPKAKGAAKAQALQLVPPERGPNAKIRPSSKARLGKVSRSVSRSRFVKRSETPGSGENALITRSGRHSIQPLAHWRGEKAVFEPGHIDKAGLTLGGIKEVIRTDEIIEERPKVRGYRRPRPRAKTPKLEDLEEDDEDKEAWEVQGGTMNASVMQWDSGANHYIEDEREEIQIAFAHNAVEMRDISGAEFRFAKTLTLPFFGSGMVDLPPGGFKRSKNSRKMQMVFFVFYGRVQVEVGTPTTRFGIGKGGMWHVPRGNFYSISNPGKTPARIFFAQGNEVAVGSVAQQQVGGDVSS